MTTDPFGGTPWATGSMYGIRRFEVSEEGWLTGAVLQSYIYEPGTNEALCLDREADPDHVIASAGCTCGFWAYNNPLRLGSREAGVVVGIVEGFGHVTYGPHGFRASKARIVAVIPSQSSHEALGGLPWRWPTRILATFIPTFLVLALVHAGQGSVDWLKMFLLAVFVTANSEVLEYWQWRKVRPKYKRFFAELPVNYPDVKTYPSLRKAFADFPLTQPEAKP